MQYKEKALWAEVKGYTTTIGKSLTAEKTAKAVKEQEKLEKVLAAKEQMMKDKIASLMKKAKEQEMEFYEPYISAERDAVKATEAKAKKEASNIASASLLGRAAATSKVVFVPKTSLPKGAPSADFYAISTTFLDNSFPGESFTPRSSCVFRRWSHVESFVLKFVKLASAAQDSFTNLRELTRNQKDQSRPMPFSGFIKEFSPKDKTQRKKTKKKEKKKDVVTLAMKTREKAQWLLPSIFEDNMATAILNTVGLPSLASRLAIVQNLVLHCNMVYTSLATTLDDSLLGPNSGIRKELVAYRANLKQLADTLDAFYFDEATSHNWDTKKQREVELLLANPNDEPGRKAAADNFGKKQFKELIYDYNTNIDNSKRPGLTPVARQELQKSKYYCHPQP